MQILRGPCKMPSMETDDPQPAQHDGEIAGENGEAADASLGELGEDSGWTTTKDAATMLGVSRRMVQEYVRRGELRAVVEGKGVTKTYYVSIDSVSALRKSRGKEANNAPHLVDASPKPGYSTRLSEELAEGFDEVLRQTIGRLETRTAEAADLRARLELTEKRLELTEKAEATLRESLERERERADAERERANRLEEELQQARRGWLRRFFGF